SRRGGEGAREPPVTPRKTRTGSPGGCCPPSEDSRKVASASKLSLPSPPNDGMGEPGLTHAGHCRWLIWNWIPLFFAPSAERFGAPRFEEPEPRYVWQVRQPTSEKMCAPRTASAGPLAPAGKPWAWCAVAARFSSLIQTGAFAFSSLAIASWAVAP